MVALDNADALAELEAGAFRRVPPAPTVLPAAGSRLEQVLWGDKWYAGTCTPRRQGLNSVQAPATLYRVE